MRRIYNGASKVLFSRCLILFISPNVLIKVLLEEELGGVKRWGWGGVGGREHDKASNITQTD